MSDEIAKQHFERWWELQGGDEYLIATSEHFYVKALCFAAYMSAKRSKPAPPTAQEDR